MDRHKDKLKTAGLEQHTPRSVFNFPKNLIISNFEVCDENSKQMLTSRNKVQLNFQAIFNKKDDSPDKEYSSTVSMTKCNSNIVEKELKSNNFLTLTHKKESSKTLVDIFSDTSHKKITDLELRTYLTKPIEMKNEKLFKCKIERKIEKKIIKFYLYLDSEIIEKSEKLVISAIKDPKKSSSHYCFSMNSDPSYIKDKQYLGTLKSNFFGTEYNLLNCSEEYSLVTISYVKFNNLL